MKWYRLQWRGLRFEMTSLAYAKGINGATLGSEQEQQSKKFIIMKGIDVGP